MDETRYYYAEINSENICFNVVDSGVEIISNTLISISSYDTTILGKVYNNGNWDEPSSPTEPTSSTQKRISDLENAIGELNIALNNTKVGMATLGASVVSRMEDVETDVETLKGVE